MDLRAYLDRVKFEGAPRADLDTLTRLHRCHLENIPYENLDVLLKRPLDFDVGRIFDKLVTRQRGGWCYEMNSLFAWALETIGFRLTRMAGCVIRDRMGEAFVGNHLVLLTHLERDYLTDVGFGDGLYEPVPLAEGKIAQNGFVSRLEHLPDGWWRFHNHQNCGSPSFDFRAEAADPAVLARTSEILKSSELSPFTQNVIFQRRLPDRVEAIRNAFRITAYPNRLERRVMTSADEMLAEMRDVFGVIEPDAASLWPQAEARGRVMLAENPLDPADTMRQRLQADLRTAMKTRDKLATDVVRALIAAIDNAGAVALDEPDVRDYSHTEGRSQYVVTGVGKTEVARKKLSANEIAALFAREAAERRAAADDIAQHGKLEEAEALRTGALLIERYRAD